MAGVLPVFRSTLVCNMSRCNYPIPAVFVLSWTSIHRLDLRANLAGVNHFHLVIFHLANSSVACLAVVMLVTYCHLRDDIYLGRIIQFQQGLRWLGPPYTGLTSEQTSLDWTIFILTYFISQTGPRGKFSFSFFP